MNSRFLRVLVSNFYDRPSTYTLHSINASSFFYPSATSPNGSSEGKSTKPDDAYNLLPRPTMSFYFPRGPPEYSGEMQFLSLGQGKTDIIGFDHQGRTILYDTVRNAIRTMPTMCAPKWQPMSATVNGSLYIIDSRIREPGSNSYEVLYYGQPPPKLSYRRDWYWRSLPMPPCIQDNEPLPSYNCDNGVEFPFEITATAVVGDSRLWISTAGAGSFSFNTANSWWSKLPGGQWALPFSGRAEYVADYNLWFGFSCQGEQLCASDLATVSACRAAPALLNAWDLDLGLPPECISGKSYMGYLGNGKFFIAKMFHVFDEDHVGIETFAVLMGVEVERSGDDGSSNGGLRMIKHRSKRYDLNDRKTIDLVI